MRWRTLVTDSQATTLVRDPSFISIRSSDFCSLGNVYKYSHVPKCFCNRICHPPLLGTQDVCGSVQWQRVWGHHKGKGENTESALSVSWPSRSRDQCMCSLPRVCVYGCAQPGCVLVPQKHSLTVSPSHIPGSVCWGEQWPWGLAELMQRVQGIGLGWIIYEINVFIGQQPCILAVMFLT